VIFLLAPLFCLHPGLENRTFISLSAALFGTANNSLDLYSILGIVGLITCATALLASEVIRRSRHNLAMEREAQELGLTFLADARPFEGSDVHGLPLLGGDPSAEAENVMQAMIDGRRALLLELPFTEACDAEALQRHFTTVAAFRCTSETPEFEIGKKSAWSKLGDALRQTPPVVEDQEFAKEYFVHCREPKKVHDWLTPVKLANLRPAAPAFHICANGDWILIFRPGAQIPPDQFPAFLRETSKIASALLQ